MSKQYTVQISKNTDVELSSQAQLSVVVPQFYREGYTLKYWKDAEGNIYTDTININSNKTISAVWEEEIEKDIIFRASDGATVKYSIQQLSNDNVPAYTLNYRGGTNRTVQQPYQSNPHLSSSVTDKEAYISNLTYLDDKNGHILTAGPHACFRCSKLRDVNLPNVTYVDKGAFAWNGALSNINIPEVRTIIDSAFYSSTGITSLNIPRVTSIGNSVFGYCTNLKYLYLLSQDIPPTLGNDKVFSGLTKYQVQVKNETYKQYLTANYWQNISSHISSVTQPIVSFLSGDTYDTLVKEEKLNYGMSAIPPEISKEGYALSGWNGNYNNVTSDTSCYAVWEATSQLEIITTNNKTFKFNYSDVPQPLRYVNESYEVQPPFNNYSDLGRYSLKEINDTDNKLLSVGVACFNVCDNLKTVNLNRLINIGNSGFEQCIHLSTNNFPLVESIGTNSFYRCVDLTSMSLSSVKTIGGQSFWKCENIQYMYIPNVETIYYSAFAACTNLSNIDFSDRINDNIPTLNNINVFNGLNDYKIQVPDRLYKEWIGENNWNNSSISSHISSVTQPIVTFLCGDTLIKEEKLNYGMSAIAPIVSRPYYDFKGWDNDYNNVSTDITCNAIFSKRFLNDDTTVLEMSNHYVTGTSADFIHTCDEINPNVSCTTDGVTRLLNNTEDYDLSYENNIVNWTNLNVGDLCSQIAQVIVTGKGYYEGQVSTDFTITYFRNGTDKVTITFDPCGGDVPSEPQDIIYNVGDTYGLCSEFNVLDTTASKVGYDFLGWFDEGRESRVLSTDIITKSTPYTLSAHWQIKKFGISAYSDPSEYGTVNESTSFISNDIDYGSLIHLSANKNFGCKFIGWSDGELLSSRNIILNDNVDISAKFNLISSTIKLWSNPSIGGRAYKDKEILTLNESASVSAYPRVGYKFKNWQPYTGQSSRMIIENENLSVTNITQISENNITIYCKFEPETYSVTLHKDGGTCTDLSSYTYSTGATLPTDWTKEGYVFEGWYDNEEFIGTSITEITTTDIGDKEYWVKSRTNMQKLKLTATNGTVCEFDYKDVPQPLVYINSSRGVQYPFNLCSDISVFNTVSEVNDEGNQISAIGYYGFGECKKLSVINFQNLLSVDKCAFMYCELNDINFPKLNTVGEIGFAYCKKLSSFDCPQVSSFGLTALSQTDLRTIYLPNIITLNNQVFLKCKNLSTAFLPNVLTVNYNAFGECENLNIIDIQNVKFIGSQAFSRCYNLSTVILSSVVEVPTLKSYAFSNTPDNISCYVPNSLVESFKSNSSWKEYSGKMNFIGV